MALQSADQHEKVDSYRHTRSVHAPTDGVIGQPTRQQIIANDLPVPLQLPCLIPTWGIPHWTL